MLGIVVAVCTINISDLCMTLTLLWSEGPNVGYCGSSMYFLYLTFV